MTDIAPELYQKMDSSFRTRVSLDPHLQAFQKKLDQGDATQEDAADYASRVAKTAAETIKAGLTEDDLPDGTLYWNIAERVILPLLKTADGMIRDAMVAAIEADYRRKGIGIKAVRGEFDEERFRRIINAMVNKSLGENQKDEEDGN